MKGETEQGKDKNIPNWKPESSLQEVLTAFGVQISESLSTCSLQSYIARTDAIVWLCSDFI